MKTTLFTIALLAVSFSSTAQLATNAFRFHHVIKRNKLNKGKYSLIYNTTVGTSLTWSNGTLATGNDTLFVENYPPNTPVNTSSDVYRLSMMKDRLKCNVSLLNGQIIVDPWTDASSGTVGTISQSIPLGVPGTSDYFTVNLSRRNSIGQRRAYEKIGFRSWAMGVAVGTFRYRPKQDTVTGTIAGTVSTALSISVNGGYAWGWSAISGKRMANFSLIGGGFVGLTSADMKAATVENPHEWKKEQDRINPAISYGVNAIFSRNNFGIVLSLGFDCNFGPNAKQWVYQNKGWIGIGVNSSLGIF